MGEKFSLDTNGSRAGFTIIELLVVISLIGLVAAAIIVFLNSGRASARDAKRVSDVQQIAKGLDLFFSECGSYPALPPSSSGIIITNSMGLFTGTVANCGTNNPVFGANGVNPRGGIGTAHNPTGNEIIFIARLPSAPTPIDDGDLTAGNRCTETNSETGAQWGEYSYVSLAPADQSHYWLYYCIGKETGKHQPGRYIMTERGAIPYTGNMFP